MGRKPSNKEVREATKDYQRSRGETPDSTRQFREAEHTARDDAAGTSDEVRGYKGPSK